MLKKSKQNVYIINLIFLLVIKSFSVFYVSDIQSNLNYSIKPIAKLEKNKIDQSSILYKKVITNIDTRLFHYPTLKSSIQMSPIYIMSLGLTFIPKLLILDIRDKIFRFLTFRFQGSNCNNSLTFM
jgi:hypothetical protein